VSAATISILSLCNTLEGYYKVIKNQKNRAHPKHILHVSILGSILTQSDLFTDEPSDKVAKWQVWAPNLERILFMALSL